MIHLTVSQCVQAQVLAAPPLARSPNDYLTCISRGLYSQCRSKQLTTLGDLAYQRSEENYLKPSSGSCCEMKHFSRSLNILNIPIDVDLDIMCRSGGLSPKLEEYSKISTKVLTACILVHNHDIVQLPQKGEEDKATLSMSCSEQLEAAVERMGGGVRRTITFHNYI